MRCIISERELMCTFAIMSSSVRLSSVCNVRAPYYYYIIIIIIIIIITKFV